MDTPVSQKPKQQGASKQQSAATKSNVIEVPSISLTKGGGAIKGIDEKFSVNAANVTAGFGISFPFSPSRNGFMPSMLLSYNSGSGNEVFGFKSNAEPPSISRQTDKKYRSTTMQKNRMCFFFSGAEDLVPALIETSPGHWAKDPLFPAGTARYKPKIEGGFARIEKIKENTGAVYWKVTSMDNVISIFDKTPSARIADPANPAKIFKWLLEFSCDDKGN